MVQIGSTIFRSEFITALMVSAWAAIGPSSPAMLAAAASNAAGRTRGSPATVPESVAAVTETFGEVCPIGGMTEPAAGGSYERPAVLTDAVGPLVPGTVFLAAVTALLLIYGVVRGEIATQFVSLATTVALLVTAVLLFVPYREGTAFGSLFIVDRLTTTMKALVLVGAAIAVLMSRAYFEQAKAWRLGAFR